MSQLSIPAGSLLAVACRDGGDADTLARRLSGTEQTGQPTLDGQPLSGIPSELRRSRILLAQNADAFFSDTVGRELAAGQCCDPADMTAALHVAQAMDIVDALPEGLETRMSGRGRSFSGVERARRTAFAW